MTTAFVAATSLELAALTAFVKAMIVKEQEIADAAEGEALARAGAGFVPVDRAPRSWEQITAYVDPATGKVETGRQATWRQRDSSAAAAEIGFDTVSGTAWTRSGAGWLDEFTGQTRFSQGAEWVIVQVPHGAVWLDAYGGRYLISTVLWIDRTTGTFSAIGPGSGEFTGGDSAARARPDGLSDLIPAPQEYVNALLRLASGGLPTQDRLALEQAIASFEAPGPWEDVRQPLYATDGNGRIVLDSETGAPLANPLRVLDVPFRGELNDYYRRLVRDHGISPFDSRTAEQFQVVKYFSVANMSTADARRFVSIHAECVRVFKAAFYNQALEAEPLYFGYCRTFIAWMAINRALNEKMRGIGDVDRMSSPEVTNLLYSFGIYQFDDMPVAYRRRLAKNLERIMSVKGTTQAFRDILSIFGLTRDVKIWKHYLVRYFPNRAVRAIFPRDAVEGEQVSIVTSHETNGVQDEFTAGSIAELAQLLGASGLFGFVRSDEFTITLGPKETDGSVTGLVEVRLLAPDGSIAGNGEVELGGPAYDMPEVGFQKADVNDPVAETTVANMDTSYLADYDEFVARDRTWEMTRDQAREQAFSVLQTKYFSMSAALDTAQNGMLLSMLWGALKDAELRGRSGGLQLPGADALPGVASINLFEAFVAVLTLTLWRFGVDDVIPHGESGVSTILQARTDGAAFPNEGSLLPYSTVVDRVANYQDPLGTQTMTRIMQGNTDTSNRILASADESTLGVPPYQYDGLRGGEQDRSFQRHTQLRRMWDFKFVSTLQTECFGGNSTYVEWLERNNPGLAAWVRDRDSAGAHIEAVITLTNIIEDALGNDRLNLFAAFGTSDVVLSYVERMVRFFKAYTTDLRDFSIYMLIDSPSTERLRLMNLIAGVSVRWTRDDALPLDELVKFLTRLNPEEHLDLDDRLVGLLGRLTKQDIAELLDSMPGMIVRKTRATRSPFWGDACDVRVGFAERDALMVRQRGEPGIAATSPESPAPVLHQGLTDRALITTN